MAIFDPQSRILISDNTGDVHLWNPQSNTVSLIAETGLALTDIAVSPNGDIYCIEARALYRLDIPSGEAIRIASLDAALYAGHNGISYANAFDIDAAGRGFVAYGDNSVIVRVDLETGSLVRTNFPENGYDSSAGDLWLNRQTAATDYYVATTSYNIAYFAQSTIIPSSQYLANTTYIGSDSIAGLVGVPAGMTGISSLGLIGFNSSSALDIGVPGGVYGNSLIRSFNFDGAISGAALFDNHLDGSILGDSGENRLDGDSGQNYIAGRAGDDRLFGWDAQDTIYGGSGADELYGGAGHDRLLGGVGNDTLRGEDGNDTLYGGDGADTLNAGTGDDFIFGGDTVADLRDVIFGGDGNDRVDAGYGNDQIFGGNGNDTVEGGFGVDEIYGQAGDDVLTGSAFSDLIFGGDGADFINGGFGHDRLNGGAGADRFFHLGVAGHGSDWIQDYRAAEGDVLLAGIAGATRSQFQVNLTETAGAGAAGVQEAFVIYKPTGQILWALVDGAAQAHINLQIGAQVFDLLV